MVKYQVRSRTTVFKLTIILLTGCVSKRREGFRKEGRRKEGEGRGREEGREEGRRHVRLETGGGECVRHPSSCAPRCIKQLLLSFLERRRLFRKPGALLKNRRTE